MCVVKTRQNELSFSQNGSQKDRQLQKSKGKSQWICVVMLSHHNHLNLTINDDAKRSIPKFQAHPLQSWIFSVIFQ